MIKTTKSKTLVVDLDGTLIKTDLLYESFWGVLSSKTRQSPQILSSIFSGRAALKEKLAEKTGIEPAQLPYNQDVIDLVQDWRNEGGKTVLATASNEKYANSVAQHLGLFDQVHGSSAEINIKGRKKAELLNREFGAGQYIYVGDSTADFPIWKDAERAITIGLSKSKRRKVDSFSEDALHLDGGSSAKAYLKALRPHQWLKNLLIFLPVILAHSLSWTDWSLALMAFSAFSLIASGVYVLNDMLDLKADRSHPRKRKRPFASGAVPLAHGMVMAPLLFLLGLFVGATIGNTAFLASLGIYVVLTTGYSFLFKRKMVFDITVLAGLYTIRIIAGALATSLSISVWLLAFSIFIFFSLAAVKRQTELVSNGKEKKDKISGRAYSIDDLPIITMMAIGSGYVGVMVMALYINAQTTLGAYHRPEFLWGICPLLLYWISRTVLISHRGEMHDDPIVFAVRDRISQLTAIGIFALMMAGVFL